MRSVQSVFLILLFSQFGFSQSNLDRKISLNIQNKSIRFVINYLQNEYDLRFSFSSDFVALEKKISVSIRKKPLSKALKQIFTKNGIQYKEIGQQIVLRPRPTSSKSKRLPTKPSSIGQIPPLLQTVRGRVIDKDSKVPLIGAAVSVQGSTPFIGSATDNEGNFILKKIPIGRNSFEISYLGYEPLRLNDIMVISGKEMVLTIELKESTTALSEVIIRDDKRKMAPLNEMALISTRSFSVEETSRYAAGFMDPARMARSFAGVSSRDDLGNNIIIRGNAPTNLLWRLEGIEIPNPNHYSSIGSSGGAISMLSISTLNNSDFMTGAFPAEYGNSVSGVFDLRIRNGNAAKSEASIMLGTLGLEFSMEGPIKKGSGASFLFNYRYSSLDILDRLGINPVQEAGNVPRYQDMSFKVTIPTKNAGRFSLFGLGGLNVEGVGLEFDEDEITPDFAPEEETIGLGILGLSHLYFLSNKTYIKTVIAATQNILDYDYFLLNDAPDYTPWFQEREDYHVVNWRGNLSLNHKFSAKSSIRTGIILSKKNYELTLFQRLLEIDGPQYDFLDEEGLTNSIQSFFQWKYSFAEQWTVNAGIHQLYSDLSPEVSIEPRLAIQYKIDKKQLLNAGFGKHSYISDITTYLFRNPFGEPNGIQPFRNIALPKALHFIIGYERQLKEQLRLKFETYFQHLYDVPASDAADETWLSALNIEDTYDIIAQVDGTIESSGKGRNWGAELTLEQFMHNGIYYLSTISFYRSQYSTIDGTYFSTIFDGNYIFNVLAGKELIIDSNNALEGNLRFVLAGGNRYSPIDLERSIESGSEILDYSNINAVKGTAYWRADIGLAYTINRPKVTHRFQLDIQNVFDRNNILSFAYNRAAQEISPFFQAGIIPILNYRASF